MNKVYLMAIEGSSGPLKLQEKNITPTNIVQKPKQDIEELKLKKYFRFKQCKLLHYVQKRVYLNNFFKYLKNILLCS